MDELKKEIRRLLRNSFISARMKPLRKQEDLEDQEEEHSALKILSDAMYNLEEVTVGLARFVGSARVSRPPLEEILSYLDGVVEKLEKVYETLNDLWNELD